VIDGRLSNLDRLSEHRKLLERAVARFQDDGRVVGLAAGGSLAHGAADFYSDVDLYIVVQDEGFDEIFGERDATVEAVGSPLFGFVVDPMPGGSTDHIVIYEGPVKFDFMYLKESDFKPAPKWAGCAVLKDARSRGSRHCPLRRACAGSTDSRGTPRPEPEGLDLVLVRLRQDRARRAVGSARWSP
jgi:predicted nucleotidyltransferase